MEELRDLPRRGGEGRQHGNTLVEADDGWREWVDEDVRHRGWGANGGCVSKLRWVGEMGISEKRRWQMDSGGGKPKQEVKASDGAHIHQIAPIAERAYLGGSVY